MKKIGFSIVAVMVVSSFTWSAAAQDRVLARADIPFTFEAQGQTFGSGSYELLQFGGAFVRLQKAGTHLGVSLMSPQNITQSSTTMLKFHNYGGRYFLAAVVAPSYQIYLPKSKSEKEMAAAGHIPVTITLALK